MGNRTRDFKSHSPNCEESHGVFEYVFFSYAPCLKRTTSTELLLRTQRVPVLNLGQGRLLVTLTATNQWLLFTLFSIHHLY
jgi:hypothetical protein